MSPPARPETAPAAPGTSLWRGAALNLAARLATVALGLAILVVVARQGPQVQGAFSLFVAIEAAVLALGSGLGLLLAREAARGALAPTRLRRGLAAALAAGVVAALVLAAVARMSDSEPYRLLWVMALAAPCLLLAPTAVGLWMGQGRLVALNVAQVGAPALVLALLLAFGVAAGPATGPSSAAASAAATGAGLLAVLAAWAIAKALAAGLAAGWALARPQVTLAAAPPMPVGEAWRFMAAIALANVVSLANYRATLFVLERAHGLAEAGVYSVAVQVAELLWLLSQAVTVSAYARIGSTDTALARATALRAVRLGLGAALAAAPLLGLAAWLLLPAVLGQAYRASLVPLALLLPGVAAYAAASALSAYYTQHLGRPHWAAGIAGLSLALTLVVAALAVPRWGAAGAAVATSSAFLIAVGVALALFARDTGLGWAALLRGDNARLPPAP